MSTVYRHSLARFAFAALLWFTAWSCLIVSLTKSGEPWPWGGLAIYLAIVAMTATLWWMVEVVAHKAVKQVGATVEVVVRAEVEDLQQDHDTLPVVIAEAVAQALTVTPINKP